MHRADEHVDFVALHELVGILRRLGRLSFVVHGEVFELAPAELAAALVYRELETVGNRRAELRVGPGVRQHQTDADLARLGEGKIRQQRAGAEQAGGGQKLSSGDRCYKLHCQSSVI